MPAPRKTILLVEDDPTSLKLTAKLLRAEGYLVHIASTAEQALTALSTEHPDLMLVDLQLPGMSGLELTREVKAAAGLRDVVVIALTACTAQDTRQAAQQAGCNGYLTKPIDSRTLALRVHEFLNADPHPGTGVVASPVPEPDPLLPESEMESLRHSFLAEGSTHLQQLLTKPDSTFDAMALGRLVHPWVGSASLLGFTRISELARETETLLRTPSSTASQLRISLSHLARAFSDLNATGEGSTTPEFILRPLIGQSFALIGFSSVEAERICRTLEHVGAKPTIIAPEVPPDYAAVHDCSLVMVHVRPENLGSRWLSPELVEHRVLPLVLVGEWKDLLCLSPVVPLLAQELLIDDWHPQEALIRLSLVLSRISSAAPVSSGVGAASLTPVCSAPTPRKAA